MGRRSILLVTAVVVAALGTVLVFMYANQARQAGLAAAEPVNVLVATDTIPAGTTAADLANSGAVELQELPAASIPQDAISDLRAVADLRTNTGIYPGQVLIVPMFSEVQETTALSLPEGTMGISIGLADPNRVAGFVTPGSEVAVFVTLESNGQEQTNLLLDRILVVGVGPTTTTTKTTSTAEGTNEEEISRAILTLAVTTDQAKKIAYATNAGTLHFALLDESSAVAPGDSITSDNIFG